MKVGTFKKYYQNVWVACMLEECEKGEVIQVENRYGDKKENHRIGHGTFDFAAQLVFLLIMVSHFAGRPLHLAAGFARFIHVDQQLGKGAVG